MGTNYRKNQNYMLPRRCYTLVAALLAISSGLSGGAEDIGGAKQLFIDGRIIGSLGGAKRVFMGFAGVRLVGFAGVRWDSPGSDLVFGFHGRPRTERITHSDEMSKISFQCSGRKRSFQVPTSMAGTSGEVHHEWSATTSELLGLQSTLRPRGRPRKETYHTK